MKPLPSQITMIRPFRLGPWTVNPPLHRILTSRRTVPLEPRLMHLLVCLASRPGQVVSRTALLKTVWGEDAGREKALTDSISYLRKILGDSADAPRYIETIRQGGYRLLASVEPLEEKPRPSRRPLLIGGLLVVTLALAGWAALRHRVPPPSPTPRLRAQPFTTYPGRESDPALSPDGTQVVFSRDEGRGDRDLFLKQMNTESPLRLTEGPADDTHPAWSPDGSTVAFARRTTGGLGIYMVPAIGGPCRRLAQAQHGIFGLDWSPDGRWIAFSACGTRGVPIQILRLEVDSGRIEPLSHPPLGTGGDYLPAFSADGHRVAFVRLDRARQHDLLVLPVAGGDARRLVSGRGWIAGLDWHPGDRQIVFSTSVTGQYSLWRVATETGEVTQIDIPGADLMCPTLSRAGERLVYEAVAIDHDIWRAPLGSPGASSPVRWIASTRSDYGAQVSPAGDRIAFISTRGGAPQLWVCDPDGADPRALTAFADLRIGQPYWDPQGRRVAYTAIRAGRAGAYITDTTTGRHRPLDHPSGHVHVVGWSPDGEALLVNVDLGERWQAWLLAVDGSARRAVSPPGCRMLSGTGQEGGGLYFLRADTPGLWRKTSIDGELACALAGEVIAHWAEIIPTREGLLFAREEADHLAVGLHPHEGGPARELATIPRTSSGLAISPDGAALFYQYAQRVESDLLLVEGFR